MCVYSLLAAASCGFGARSREISGEALALVDDWLKTGSIRMAGSGPLVPRLVTSARQTYLSNEDELTGGESMEVSLS